MYDPMCMCVCVYVFICVIVYVCMYVCMCVYVCMYVCMLVCLFVCIYVYIHEFKYGWMGGIDHIVCTRRAKSTICIKGSSAHSTSLLPFFFAIIIIHTY